MRSPDGGFLLEDDGDAGEADEGRTVPVEVRNAMESAAASFRHPGPQLREPTPVHDSLLAPEAAENSREQAEGIASKVQLLETGYLSKAEQQSVADSVHGLLEFAERRLVTLAADLIAPGAGRVIDLAFQVNDLVGSVRALASDNPVLEIPLPFPVPGIDFSAEIPLADGEEVLPVALCVAPDSPSLTWGWALDSAEQDSGPEEGHAVDQVPDDATEAEMERVLEQRAAASLSSKPDVISSYAKPLRYWAGVQIGCIVATDLGRLGFLKRRRLRAWELFVLATEYAAPFRKKPGLQRFDVLVITDPKHRCGLWIRLGP